MSFDINNFVVDECKRVFSRNSDTGAMNFLVSQIEDPSIQCDSEEIVKNDAKGTPIAKWSQGKTATFSASNSLLDFNLMSWQFNGEGKTIAGSGSAVNAPAIEEKTLTSDDLLEIILANNVVNSGTVSTPVYKITVSTLTRDGACKKTFTQGVAVSAGVFTYTAATKKLTFAANDLEVGDKIFIAYEYSTENAVVLYNSADKYATSSEIWVEVKGHDICATSTIYAGYIVFPNATLSANTTVSLGKEDSFPFEFSAAQDYCSDNKELFKIVIPQPAA